jgi:hypothetical protein
MDLRIKYKRFANLTLIFFGILFLVQVLNKAVFTHSHLTPDGRLITHAHPFDKANDNQPVKSHYHSLAETVVLQQLELIFPIIALLFGLLSTWFIQQIWEYVQILFSIKYPKSISGRAPPAF